MNWGITFYCTWCGSTKHNLNTCPKLNREDICSFCGQTGHSATHCPRRYWNIDARKLERMRQLGTFDGVDLTE